MAYVQSGAAATSRAVKRVAGGAAACGARGSGLMGGGVAAAGAARRSVVCIMAEGERLAALQAGYHRLLRGSPGDPRPPPPAPLVPPPRATTQRRRQAWGDALDPLCPRRAAGHGGEGDDQCLRLLVRAGPMGGQQWRRVARRTLAGAADTRWPKVSGGTGR
ncbi:hypothetical protein E2C01_087990 [Portunus trituberculatus]|uniref:Uncharacterized protein n=1 Tax=Portunus trituberculatus TaxID=210409 RepID=A0A5B7JHZ0_PORTR|nr:hypothetical protein [Portunus trituberculatus]